jgi:hypothetical protein
MVTFVMMIMDRVFLGGGLGLIWMMVGVETSKHTLARYASRLARAHTYFTY